MYAPCLGNGPNLLKEILEVLFGYVPMQILDGQLASRFDLIDLGFVLREEHGCTRGAIARATRNTSSILTVSIMLP